MGTAIRSGPNRAVAAAQAAMASPLLEAGAIDGARGILINITGSSSLKLSEVNEASSLIQTAAHEDANIIFGAVLDEQMGDDVKITVIATGFRDQMPERRARMLSIGEVVVAEEPVVSVPVVATANWMNEPAAPVIAVAKADAPAPFLSDVEDEAEESDESYFFASSSGSAAAKESVAPRAPEGKMNRESVPEPRFDSGFDSGFGSRQPELVAAAARPQFAEMVEEPTYTPLPRDYAGDFGTGTRAVMEQEQQTQPAAMFSETDEEAQRDLDTPTFLRRLRF
jgi:cell division protein FtsZ